MNALYELAKERRDPEHQARLRHDHELELARTRLDVQQARQRIRRARRRWVYLRIFAS